MQNEFDAVLAMLYTTIGLISAVCIFIFFSGLWGHVDFSFEKFFVRDIVEAKSEEDHEYPQNDFQTVEESNVVDSAPVETTVEEIFTAYEKDHKASDKRFINRRLILTDCVVAYAQRDDWAGGTFLSVYSRTKRDAKIQCYLYGEYDSSFGEEDEIIIRGKCTGKYAYITLIDCVLVKKDTGEDAAWGKAQLDIQIGGVFGLAASITPYIGTVPTIDKSENE